MRPSFLILLVVLAAACRQKPDAATLTPEERQQYLQHGKEITQAAFKTLSGELKHAILVEQSIPNGIRTCSQKAGMLTDSLSRAYHARIKRTSDKVRNPANALDEAEKLVWADFVRQHTAGQKPAPRVSLLNDTTVAFYAPIMLKPLCMKCHGTVGQTIDTADYRLIQSLYPDDRATGYKAGDLRGMWSVRFPRTLSGQ